MTDNNKNTQISANTLNTNASSLGILKTTSLNSSNSYKTAEKNLDKCEQKIIFFARLPKLGFGKTRLRAFLSENQIYEISSKLFSENLSAIIDTNIPFSIHYAGDNFSFLNEHFGKISNIELTPQIGKTLGKKMYNSLSHELKLANKVILIGSDICSLTKEKILNSFTNLENSDITLTPSEDGGFGVVGMKKPENIFTNIAYSTPSVLSDTLALAKEQGLTYALTDSVYDIDTMEDLVRSEIGSYDFSLLGFGEYNLNYKTGNKVFRINIESQLGLGDNQIKYEYNALKELADTGVVPQVFSHGLGRYLPYPYLFMDFLEGRPLNYQTDMRIAAKLLSAIHNHPIGENSTLIRANKPFSVMYDEFLSMYAYYRSYPKKDPTTIKYIDKFMKIAKSLGLDDEISNPCIINTELNNQNFIIGDKKSYIIDWEKPLIGEAEQDIAHFLVPTTTNWKTETILTTGDVDNFVSLYSKYRAVDKDKLNKYLIFNSLRGVTWCSMAKVEYDKERTLTNPKTLQKINKFLSKEFLEFLYSSYYEVHDEHY